MKSFFVRLFISVLVAVSTFPTPISAQQPGTPAATKPTVSPERAEALAATEEIFKEVSELRELEIKRPVKSGFRTRAELEKDVLADMNESTTAKEFEAESKMLVKFGLVPPKYDLRSEMVKILTEQISGFYQPKTGEFFLADRGGLDEQKVVIAHELTHALQDQHFNLRRFENFPKGESDREAAIHALIEGDATIVMFDYLLKPLGATVTKFSMPMADVLEALGDVGGDPEKTPAYSAAPQCIRKSLLFPYHGGAGFVQELVRKGGWAQVSKAYTDLPESTEQILHPQKYFLRERPTRVTPAPMEKILGKNWVILKSDTQGEFGYGIILGEYLDRDAAARGAAGWDGDMSRLYENTATKRLVLVQTTTWDDEAEAREFADLYGERTKKRYPKIKLAARSEGLVGDTGDGWAAIVRRGRDVLVIEGLPDAAAIPEAVEFAFKEVQKSKPPASSEKPEKNGSTFKRM